MKNSSKYISKDEALAKLQSYCAYQDRCHSEVRTKLIQYKIYGDDLEDIIATLIQENFLNEERFARSFARGKFRIKSWGRNRIIQELKRKRVSEYCIKKGLSEIDEEEYPETAYKVIEKYYSKQKGFIPIKKQKTFAHAYRKGYEANLINRVLKDIIEKGEYD